MRRIAVVVALFFSFAPLHAQTKRNVLFIAVDDLNDWIGCLGGHPQVKTPAIDKLAERGTLFTNTHCQAPLCNPSRASLLTGLRPSTTGIYGLLPGIRDVETTQKVVTLPQHFALAGYRTFTFGKVFHDGSIKAKDRAKEFDVWGVSPGMPRPAVRIAPSYDKTPLMDWGIFPENDQDQADWKTTDAVVDQLKAMPKNQPFFLSVGFRLPHVPCYASKKWFDLYPESDVILPEVKEKDRSDVPDFAWYLHWKLPEPRLSWLKQKEQWRPLVRAYLASTSFMDSQVARLMEALEKHGFLENTIVVFWSDHGWHLGEKGITGKNSLWERSTRVPLIIAGPGVGKNAKCPQPAELLDLYPTLAELCQLPVRKTLEGHSLVPQLKDAKTTRIWPAITTHNQGNHSVRSLHWRYIRYADGSEELYDHRNDPNEWNNVVKNAGFSVVALEHAKFLPKVDAPHATGSALRVLQRINGLWHWEGVFINPKERVE